MSLISISGRIGSGKDTVGKIIQYLTANEEVKQVTTLEEWLDSDDLNGRDFNWKIKKFAGKLKLIGSILSGVPVENFEDQEFKKQYMSEEWNSFVSVDFPEITDKEIKDSDSILVKTTYKRMTYREFLQKLGTEAMRDGLHKEVWVNALFADYKYYEKYNHAYTKDGVDYGNRTLHYPDWIITDMRFPNELDAVQLREGITIRVNRSFNHKMGSKETGTIDLTPLHPSETALDDAEFDYEIINDGTIEDLVEKVRKILIKEGII